jgi:hypothetical protein
VSLFALAATGARAETAPTTPPSTPAAAFTLPTACAQTMADDDAVRACIKALRMELAHSHGHHDGAGANEDGHGHGLED